jgi:predicted RND superfamily exporter protein
LTLIVIVTALFGEGLVLGLVYFCGVTMNAVLTVMAPLILVLTVSAGVHLINYYRDEIRMRGQYGAVQRALANAWAPCALAALTTAIGLASLTVSNIIPVSQFGLFAGIGILSTTALLFLVVPGLMVKWPVVPNTTAYGEEMASPQVASAQVADPAAAWDRLSAAVCRFSLPILIVCVTWMLVSLVGVSKIKTSVNVLSLLEPSSRTVRDYQWLEENVAPMVPIEIVLSVDEKCQLDLLQQMELVRRVQAELDQLEHLEGTMSAATFFPSIPSPGGIRRMARRVLLNKKLGNQRQALVAAHYLYEPDTADRSSLDDMSHGRSWRISARAPAIADLDYGLFLKRIRNRVQPVLDTFDEQGNPGISATYTGIMPVVYNVQRLLLSDLIRSYATALILVAFVMIVVQRSVYGGLFAMLPNMFPTFILFGTMGWLQKPVDIGSMMTASVALGIAVDGTLHFLYWFRREIHQGRSRRDAVGQCYRHCARAITQTAIICGLGLLVYSLSGFVPTRRFAWMMFALLLAALIGDLLLLPALLVSPLGKFLVSAPGATESTCITAAMPGDSI